MVDPSPALPDSTPPRASAGGFAAVSQKLKRRTTDLLALAILSVGLLAVGAKLGRWWKQSPEEAIHPANLASQVIPWGDEGTGVTLNFGPMNHALFRQIITGDAASASEQLEQIVLAQLPNVSLAPHSLSPAERKLLEELKNVPVSEALPTGESLYRIGEDLPMVIVTKPYPVESHQENESPRIICWARAFPQSENRWMVILFHPVEGTPSASQSTIPLPRGSERIQSLQDTHGQSWAAFHGPGPIQEWQTHFDHWFRGQNWDVVRPWSGDGSVRTIACQSPDARKRAEVWLSVKAKGRCEGMVIIETIPAKRP